MPPSLDVLETKIRPPAMRPGIVRRPGLVNRLCRDGYAVVTLVAPVGYGKTALLADWASAEPRTVAWLTIDERDNDPGVLRRHLAAAEGRARGPLLFVVDDVDLLNASPALDVVAELAAHAPAGSTVALAGRSMPRLTQATLTARGELREIAVDELALAAWEARRLLKTSDVTLDEEQMLALIELCEGWPAALYLAALSLRDSPSPSSRSLTGTDRYLAEYMRTECLARMSAADMRFLRRASILAELTAPLCDSVLEIAGSQRELAKLARTRLAVVPVDGVPGRYRLRRLFRDLLRRELVEEEPHLLPALHRRAADWYERAGDAGSALEHADGAGDTAHVAAILARIAMSASNRGHAAKLERWLARFDHPELLDMFPAVALHGSRIHAFRGRLDDAERWLEAAERGARRRTRDAPALRARNAVVRAALCREGPEQMLRDARSATARLPEPSEWYPAALQMRAAAAALLGQVDEADALLGEAAEAAGAQALAETRMLALAQRSLLGRQRGDDPRADGLAAEAQQLVSEAGLDTYATSAVALAAAASAALSQRRRSAARELLAAAGAVRPALNEALPWLAVATRVELGRCHVAVGDVDGAFDVLAEIDATLERRPGLGVLLDRVRELRRDVERLSHPEPVSARGLTPAELRLLPLLATHLSFREIAERLDISRNTVKTQAISIYRKLGVSGRSEAISAAARIGASDTAAGLDAPGPHVHDLGEVPTRPR